jgi:hypothetical protein
MGKSTSQNSSKGTKTAPGGKKGGEINEKDLGKIAGGINPQPLPPRAPRDT